MKIRKEIKPRINETIRATVPKLESVLRLIDKVHIDYFCDEISDRLMKDETYIKIYRARAIYMMTLIRMVAGINNAVSLTGKSEGLITLHYTLNRCIHSSLEDAELSYIDVQILYKNSLEVTNNFLRFNKEKDSYYCKSKLDLYEIIECIDKFNFTAKYVLIKNKKGNDEK